MSQIKIGILGLHQAGKSLLINCLLGRNISKVGDGNATTHTTVVYSFSKEEYVNYKDHEGFHEDIDIEDVKSLNTDKNIHRINVFLNNPLLRNYTLFDLPGTGYNISDDSMTRDSLDEIDCAILIATNVKEYTNASSFYSTTLVHLKTKQIPYYFILNCVKKEYWSPKNKHNSFLIESNLELLHDYEPLSLNDDPIVNLMWYWCSVADENDDIYKDYIDSVIENFEHRRKPYNADTLRVSSNFDVVKSIFSYENRIRLELKKDLREKINEINDQICPVGTIQSFAFPKLPKEQESWLVCDGRYLGIDEYPELFNAIGFTFGGDNLSEFRIPDLRGQFLRGWDKEGICDVNRPFGSSQEDAFQDHSHFFEPSFLEARKDGEHVHDTYAYWYNVGNWGSDTKALKELRTSSEYHDSTGNVSKAGDHTHKISCKSNPILQATDINGTLSLKSSYETRPKNVALLFCIKAKNSNKSYIATPPAIKVDIKDLNPSNDGTIYSGFAILAKDFALLCNGSVVNDIINVEVYDQMDKNPVYHSSDNNGFRIKTKEKGLCSLKYSYTGEIRSGSRVAILSIVKVDTIGIIGQFNNWKESIDMSPDSSNLLFSCELKMAKDDRFKFMVNNEWAFELDGVLSHLFPHNSDKLICRESGDYEIMLDIRKCPFKFTMIKKKQKIINENSIDKIKPNNPELDLNSILSKINSIL